MSRTYRITPRAADDIRSIGQYTQINWGRKQRNRYLRVLDKRFAWLAENPGMGKHRTDIKDGYYSYPEGSHVVFYLVREDGIDILGIPHQHMDVLNYFLRSDKQQGEV